MRKIGFDNEKYIKLQSQNIRDRIAMFGGKLYAVHMNDNYGSWDDDMIAGSVNTIPYLEFIYWLRRTGYNGYITFDQFPYREESREAVNESAEWFDYLEGLIDKTSEKDYNCIQQVLDLKDGVAASRLIRKILNLKVYSKMLLVYQDLIFQVTYH